jgi:hypothetical protein
VAEHVRGPASTAPAPQKEEGGGEKEVEKCIKISSLCLTTLHMYRKKITKSPYVCLSLISHKSLLMLCNQKIRYMVNHY